jgi:hypothetical protein
MGRWDFDDDARSPDMEPARSDAARQDREPEIRDLPDTLKDRDRDQAERGREHDLTLPAGRDRELIRHDGRDYHLRGSEVDLLERTGRFRAVFTEDLRRDADDPSRFREDLRSLQRQALIDQRTVTRLRDGTVADVVAVTRAGRELLDHHRDPAKDVEQVYYDGWVKPAEIWHDATLYRMVRAAERDVDQDGGRVRLVMLDDELKADAFGALYDARHEHASDEAAHEAVAREQHLPLNDGHFVFPDVRLEVEYPDGTVRTVDLELVTEHYHRGHLGGKASAGFRMFSAQSVRRGGTPHDPRVVGKAI